MKYIVTFLIFVNILLAAPALDVSREFKQADGTTFTARAQGNQHLNWVETPDGEILRYNRESKNFEYANIKDNQLKASGTAYNKSNSLRARSLGQINKVDKDALFKLRSEKLKEAQEKRRAK